MLVGLSTRLASAERCAGVAKFPVAAGFHLLGKLALDTCPECATIRGIHKNTFTLMLYTHDLLLLEKKLPRDGSQKGIG